MIRAYVKIEPCGYVVWGHISDHNGNTEHYPLRNFGECHSAAMEFRDYINRPKIDHDRLERHVRGWAKSYNPETLYTYPTFLKSGEVALIKQR